MQIYTFLYKILYYSKFYQLYNDNTEYHINHFIHTFYTCIPKLNLHIIHFRSLHKYYGGSQIENDW